MSTPALATSAYFGYSVVTEIIFTKSSTHALFKDDNLEI